MGIIDYDNQIGGVPAQKIASNTLVLVIANNHEFDFDKTWILEMFHQRRLNKIWVIPQPKKLLL